MVILESRFFQELGRIRYFVCKISMLKEFIKLLINLKWDIILGNFYQKVSKNQYFQGMIYFIDLCYFDVEFVVNYNFWKFNVFKNDVVGKKIEIYGNENLLIVIFNKYSVNFV